MASFAPLKDSLLLCIDQAMRRLPIDGPFLDVGCGSGDVSVHMASRGLQGTAMDLSDTAVVNAASALHGLPVKVVHGGLEPGPREYGCVLFMDVLEHVRGDVDLLELAAGRLVDGGHMLISVPSNPREWRWDDDFYGHVRRYTIAEIEAKLRAQGLTTRIMWDFTFPTFWLMRRAYTRVKSQPRHDAADEMSRTLASSFTPAHHIPVVSPVLAASTRMWKPIFRLQFRLFRNQILRGHEMFIVAQRTAVTPYPLYEAA